MCEDSTIRCVYVRSSPPPQRKVTAKFSYPKLFSRSGIAKTLPKLKVLDGEKMETALNTDNSDLKTIFYPICRAQIAAQDDLLRRQNAEKE